jgi:serine/threonine-protein kinase PknG
VTCTQPGCSGTIEDGYCVQCGMAPPPSGSGERPSGPSCAQPGCAGAIADGYCDICGAAEGPAGGAQSAESRAGGAQGTGSRPGGAQGTGSRAGGAQRTESSAGGAQGTGLERCVQPGCAGAVKDGYCDVCGLPPAPESTPSRPTGATRSTRSSRTSGRRGALGAGLVEVPSVPYRDPASAVLTNASVPESRRFCGNCNEPVGRRRGDRPGRTEGFCAGCGTAFSFTPKLDEGELVGGQYEVLGCIAHGGLGWIYLARDRNVNDRWVVLKGLLDTGDADALAAATAERAFLAEVEHPNIVKIYNFVQHAGSGYIVMEYVGGRPLKDILRDRREESGPEAALPLGQVIAYGLEVLRAFGYLHGLGLLFCDFKPDNAIQSEEQLKLIDLGGVRRIDDAVSAIYGTVGYQAPEVPDVGPSVASDLYTVGRTLAVLSFPFKGFTGTYSDALPPRDTVAVLAANESYDRFLRRATHADAAARFLDAGEMAEQLTGVLREVLSAEDGGPRPAASTLFGPERLGVLDLFDPSPLAPMATPLRPPGTAAAAALPAPLVDAADPAAGFLAGLTAMEPAQLVTALAAAPERSPEVDLMLARVHLELGDQEEAAELLDRLPRGDWRVGWYRAIAALTGGRPEEAARLFDALYALLPGEAAPKLALASCLEPLGDLAGAGARYEMVWRTDHGYVSAAFGLARVRLAAGDRAGAVAALDMIPKISGHYVPAQVAAVAATVRDRAPTEIPEAELMAAGTRLAGLRLDTGRHGRLAVEVLGAALERVRVAGDGAGSLLGAPLTEDGLRRRLEETYRSLAHLATAPAERHVLVDRANAVRPRTLV